MNGWDVDADAQPEYEGTGGVVADGAIEVDVGKSAGGIHAYPGVEQDRITHLEFDIE